jgi:hypothetical protein
VFRPCTTVRGLPQNGSRGARRCIAVAQRCTRLPQISLPLHARAGALHRDARPLHERAPPARSRASPSHRARRSPQPATCFPGGAGRLHHRAPPSHRGAGASRKIHCLCTPVQGRCTVTHARCTSGEHPRAMLHSLRIPVPDAPATRDVPPRRCRTIASTCTTLAPWCTRLPQNSSPLHVRAGALHRDARSLHERGTPARMLHSFRITVPDAPATGDVPPRRCRTIA